MQKHHYEISFTSRFALDDSDVAEIIGLISDVITPEETWESIKLEYIDSEGFDD